MRRAGVFQTRPGLPFVKFDRIDEINSPFWKIGFLVSLRTALEMPKMRSISCICACPVSGGWF
jgi:hypothetical protein